MGNWMNGLWQFANTNGGDASKETAASFRAGVEWGRKDMLQHAITMMQETHDACVDKSEALDGYEMARELVRDWTQEINTRAENENPIL